MILRLFLLFVLVAQAFSCSFMRGEETPSEYFKWINNESNGLIKKKHVNGFEFIVKYLPPEYLAYQELRNEKSFSKERKDSLITIYSNNMTFLLSIAPDESEGSDTSRGDVMFTDIKDMSDYQDRVMLLNFDMKDYLQLKIDSLTSYKPVLTNMENTYGLSMGRSITCVFAPLKDIKEFKKVEQFDFIWDDEVFQSGRNHFVFNSKDFSSVPNLKF